MKFVGEYLCQEFKIGMSIEPGDIVKTPFTHEEHLVIGKSKKARTHYSLLCIRRDRKIELGAKGEPVGTMKNPFIFKVPYLKGAKVSCDISQWEVLRKRDAPCVPYDNELCLKYGRVLVGELVSVLCSECGEEAGQHETIVYSRKEAHGKKWFLDDAYFDKHGFLCEKWRCNDCLFSI